MASRYAEAFAANLKELLGDMSVNEFSKRVAYLSRRCRVIYSVKGKSPWKIYVR